MLYVFSVYLFAKHFEHPSYISLSSILFYLCIAQLKWMETRKKSGNGIFDIYIYAIYLTNSVVIHCWKVYIQLRHWWWL